MDNRLADTLHGYTLANILHSARLYVDNLFDKYELTHENTEINIDDEYFYLNMIIDCKLLIEVNQILMHDYEMILLPYTDEDKGGEQVMQLRWINRADVRFCRNYDLGLYLWYKYVEQYASLDLWNKKCEDLGEYYLSPGEDITINAAPLKVVRLFMFDHKFGFSFEKGNMIVHKVK